MQIVCLAQARAGNLQRHVLVEACGRRRRDRGSTRKPGGDADGGGGRSTAQLETAEVGPELPAFAEGTAGRHDEGIACRGAIEGNLPELRGRKPGRGHGLQAIEVERSLADERIVELELRAAAVIRIEAQYPVLTHLGIADQGCGV